jgi:hypothetical protein
MFEGMERKLFGSTLTVLLVIMYFEIRDLRIQVKDLRRRLDQHVFVHFGEKEICKNSKKD